MEKVNWGIIGCGDVTELKSGPAFNKVDHSALVAVMRRDVLKAADYAARHQVPKWYNDAQQLIDDPQVNAVYIATPPSTHKQFAIAALSAGKPVYVEKPMAMNAIEATAMTDFSRKTDIKLSIAHYRREQPKFKKIKELLDNNAIGDVRFCRLVFTRPPLSVTDLKADHTFWRVSPAVSGGGLFHDLAPHQLDLMYYFFGSMKSVQGFAINQAGTYHADDLVTGNILFDSGVAFNGMWSFSAAPGQDADQCEIIGSTGKITFSCFENQSVSLTIKDETEIYSFEPLLHVQLPMIKKVVEYFLDRASNPCSADAGLVIMKLLDAFTVHPE